MVVRQVVLAPAISRLGESGTEEVESRRLDFRGPRPSKFSWDAPDKLNVPFLPSRLDNAASPFAAFPG